MDLEDDESGEQSETPLDMSVNRSGMIRIATEDAASQTEVDFHSLPQPPIRNLRDIDPRVKRACVKASVKCNMSTAMGPVAVQAVCVELYGHQYYLTKEEVIQKDPALTKQ